MNGSSNTFLFVFAALFPVINSLGSIAHQNNARLALGVALNSFLLLLGSMLFSSFILEFFGISVPVVRVAGGMLVTAMGWKLLAEPSGPKRDELHETAAPAPVKESLDLKLRAPYLYPDLPNLMEVKGSETQGLSPRGEV